MPLYEYQCEGCGTKFEKISSVLEPEPDSCPSCQGSCVKKLISKFAVGGQGDLRESTLHGCHGHYHGLDSHHDHNHDHNHNQDQSQAHDPA